ncbi:fumarylacetoacetate hydrolase family protein [Rhodococcus coprophilus]|uniref:Fumarylacetoacetate hydrolase family protein n=1 Tax=Rhodococcus coprophilus TaxID=38310 RepID=A0A2X4TMG1_9NOCA|nr:fumarylacetoacetate hydrolase family protein [Rhodococcus coprophilus]MBM7460779.1 2-keto-4-pentenoate hydratase/2-oxohepta-3-ene-1,7-dioic acid hydratase in catechol pathway [Rhodococcus coprophilus]SQI28586.1 fumarylacetoacetate hydrolase family protein [Rhodococcus coprophilus]
MSFEIGRVRIGKTVVPCARMSDGVVRDARGAVSDWAGSALDPDNLCDIEDQVMGFPSIQDSSQVEVPFSGSAHLVCIGQNFHDHAAEVQVTMWSEDPLCYLKPVYTLSTSGMTPMPEGCRTMSWEGELAVVVGRAAHRLLNPSDALSAVAGYTTSNDMGDYDWVLHRGGQWVKGKAFPDFNPIGRWLRVGRKRHPPPESLLTTRVNGAVVQMAQLSDMRYTPPYLVWYVSQFLCLMPGDVINCGTPGGTALATQNYLQVGDVVEVDISNVGTHCTRIV